MRFEFNERLKIDKIEQEKREALARTTICINAGGKGSRLASFENLPKNHSGITKALIEFAGKPMIENHTNLLEELGFRNIIVVAGDHLDIADYFQKNANEKISIINTDQQEDTGGDLIKAMRQSENIGSNVLVENVDSLAYIEDLGDLILQHEESGADATIVLTTKKGVPNEGAFFVDENGMVVFCGEARSESGLKEPENWKGYRGSSTGIVLFRTDILKNYEWQSGTGEKLSLYRDIIPQLVKEGRVHAHDNGENFFIDTGTPIDYEQVKRHEIKLLGALNEKYKKQLK